jgi:hypothetical protein
MPAVLIRQLQALSKIVEQSTDPEERALLLEQAERIFRASEESVPEPADRAAARRAYEYVLAAAGRLEVVSEGPPSGADGLAHDDGPFTLSSAAGTRLHQAGSELPGGSAESALSSVAPRPSLRRPTSDTSQSPGARR